MKYQIPIVAHAIVRSSLEVEAISKDEAIRKVENQLLTGDVPGVQLVSDCVWIYDELDENEDIEISAIADMKTDEELRG